MAKILTVLLLLIVAVVFAYGIHLANGEEFTVDVPFDYQKAGCSWTQNSDDWKRYDCYAEWVSDDHVEEGEEYPPSVDGCPSGLDIDYLTGECKPHEWIEREAELLCEEDPDCPRGFFIPEAEKTKWQKELEKIDPRDDSASKDELIRLINEMLDKPSQCYQGVGTTAGSQEKRSFDIPTYEYTDENGVKKMVLDVRTSITDLKLRGILGQIMADARECAAQIILLDPQGGVMSLVDANFAYCDTVDSQDKSQFLRCGKTYDHQANAQNVPVWSQQRVNEEANRDIDHHVWNVIDDICNGYYERSYKMVFQDCRDLALVSNTEGYAVKRPELKYYDDSEFQNYRDYGDEDQFDKIIEQRLAEKIQQAYREYQAAKK